MTNPIAGVQRRGITVSILRQDDKPTGPSSSGCSFTPFEFRVYYSRFTEARARWMFDDER